MSKWLATPSKYASPGAAIAAELMIGFCFGVEVILAIGVVNRFESLCWSIYEQQVRLPPLRQKETHKQ